MCVSLLWVIVICFIVFFIWKFVWAHTMLLFPRRGVNWCFLFSPLLCCVFVIISNSYYKLLFAAKSSVVTGERPNMILAPLDSRNWAEQGTRWPFSFICGYTYVKFGLILLVLGVSESRKAKIYVIWSRNIDHFFRLFYYHCRLFEPRCPKGRQDWWLAWTVRNIHLTCTRVASHAKLLVIVLAKALSV